MSAVERALERGREASTKRGRATVEPHSITYPGRLVAYVSKNGGEPEGVQIIAGTFLYYALAQDKEGRTYAPPVRDAETKRVVKAMIDPPDEEEFYDLIRETFGQRREAREAAAPSTKRVRRGRTD